MSKIQKLECPECGNVMTPVLSVQKEESEPGSPPKINLSVSEHECEMCGHQTTQGDYKQINQTFGELSNLLNRINGKLVSITIYSSSKLKCNSSTIHMKFRKAIVEYDDRSVTIRSKETQSELTLYSDEIEDVSDFHNHAVIWTKLHYMEIFVK